MDEKTVYISVLYTKAEIQILPDIFFSQTRARAYATEKRRLFHADNFQLIAGVISDMNRDMKMVDALRTLIKDIKEST
jgi:hypothetical protein